jgi:membrane protease YdiL (CAAX protease family)
VKHAPGTRDVTSSAQPLMSGPDRRSPLAFFGLVFALSIPFWVIGAATGIQLTPNLPISAFIWVCPVLAAAILVYREGGGRGVAAFLRRSFDYGRIRDKHWLIPALLLLPGVYVATWLVMRALGLPVPSPQLPLLAALGWLLAYLVAGQGEELGWSGYALDPLQARWNAFGASLLLGGAWVLFHLVPLAQGGRAPEWIAWWSLATLAQRVLFTWIYNNTGGSVFAAALFHAMGNLAQIGPFLDFGPGGYPLDAQRISALLLVAVAVAVIAIWGPRLLTRDGGALRGR